MEDGLVRVMKIARLSSMKCLNPCCNGRWSRTSVYIRYETCIRVLILVVMEDGLVPAAMTQQPVAQPVLILVVMEDGLVLAS